MTSFRLGAIDAGSNAIRLIVAETTDGNDFRRIEYERVPVRLGHHAFTRGELDDDTIDAAVDAFRRFRQLFDQHGVQRYRGVATSAVRNAQNRDVLLHRLYHEAGLELEVIDGDEEARLVRKAVLRAFQGHTAPRLILDLGGGSLEINVRDGAVWRGTSLPVGTVRLLESFDLTGAIGAEGAAMVRRYAATLLQHVQRRVPEDMMPAAACGGNAEALAQLVGDQQDGFWGFDLAALEHALPSILDATVEERMARFGFRQDRAEVIGVAALVLAAVGRSLGLTRLIAPGVGVREALLLELAEAAAEEKARAAGAHGKALITAGRTFAHRVGHDTSHGEQVAMLAVKLFDQLRDIHQLPDEMRVLLQLGALLHDIGEVVNTRSHHKHSEYLIRWGRIPGLDAPYRDMVAVLARTHRKSPLDAKKHVVFAALSKEHQKMVRRMSALLRLADGLDYQHRQRIDDVVVARVGDTINLDLIVSTGSTEPDPQLVRKGDVFQAEFGYAVTCTIGRPIEPPAIRALEIGSN